jgi:cbb3-type cytochrome oxidase subunit 1
MRVETVRLPLSFILTGLAALAAGNAAILVRPEILTTYHYNQWAVAVTHLFTLGWISSVIMGAMYQLVPVALETKLHSPRLGAWHFALHLAGWTGLVAAFWVWNLVLIAVFGVVVSAGMIVFLCNMALTLRGVPRWGVVAIGIASALAWLGLTALAGLVMVAGKFVVIAGVAPVSLMHAHAHAGAAGFFLMMLIAVGYKLVPMFTLSEVHGEKRALWSVALLNIGLAGTAAGIALNAGWKIFFAAVAAAAFVLHGFEIAAILRARKRPQLDAPLAQFVAGLALMIPLVLTGLVLSWPGLPATEFTTQLENAYGLLALAGVLTVCILAMLYKIVPFLVWYFSYSRHIGRSKVPALAELSSTRLQKAGFALYLPGLAAQLAGTLWPDARLARLGAVLVLLAQAVFIVNVAAMLRHLVRPRLESLPERPRRPGSTPVPPPST